MSYRLGIDTGGTFTDAVLVDEHDAIIASFKSLTTRHDLTIGIANAMAGLPEEYLQNISLVSLSTTLTTNSVVEGQGASVCVLLPGYDQRQLDQSGILDIVDGDRVCLLKGGHTALGDEFEPLDEMASRLAIVKHKDSVSAYAISSMFGTRNTTHEIKLRDQVESLTGKPVACGHELASGLGAPQRALTAALNARMVPFIQRLIHSVKLILDKQNINAPLMIVKGDGSLVGVETALQQPVATVLSGPAASVVGACALSGLKNAIVADMGGTTTDIAIVTNGQPELCSDGAKVGDWQPMVEAIRVYSIGLGGDSEVCFNATKGIDIGPRRVVPMCLLGDQYPWVIERLEHQLNDYPNARNNRFVMPLESNEVMLNQLSDQDADAWDQLQSGPLELDQVTQNDRKLARALSRLQRTGLAIYSGFTPTDATHVLGLSNHWSRTAAELSAKIWAKQMRHLYGFGSWVLGDAVAPCQQVYDQVNYKISRTLIEAGLHQFGKMNDLRQKNLAATLTDLILQNEEDDAQKNPLFQVGFNADYPIVAVGAPAASYYPQASKTLGIKLQLPKYGDVANAVGAVMGAVVQRAHATVSQPTFGQFNLYHKNEPQHFNSLEKALACAEALVKAEALELATAAGAVSVEVVLSKDENSVSHDIDGDLFLDCQITATATGRPGSTSFSLTAKDV